MVSAEILLNKSIKMKVRSKKITKRCHLLDLRWRWLFLLFFPLKNPFNLRSNRWYPFVIFLDQIFISVYVFSLKIQNLFFSVRWTLIWCFGYWIIYLSLGNFKPKTLRLDKIFLHNVSTRHFAIFLGNNFANTWVRCQTWWISMTIFR